MLWIHGGAFVGGSAIAPIYDGCALARRCGVVVVTIGYRVGALGYLGSDRLGIPHNVGHQDQLAALKFVSENVANFG